MLGDYSGKTYQGVLGHKNEVDRAAYDSTRDAAFAAMSQGDRFKRTFTPSTGTEDINENEFIKEPLSKEADA